MKKLLFIFLFIPLLTVGQSEKRYRAIIIDSVKALNNGLFDVKDTVKFDLPVSIGGADDPKAILTLTSTTQGFLATRMTTVQKNAITSPSTGLLVYDTDLNRYEFYNGTSWISVGANAITSDRIPKGTGTDITDGTWQFETNTILPTNDLSNIGITGTNRVGSLFIGGTIEYATNLNFVEGTGGVQTMRMDASSNVRIGTGAASFKLDVDGTTSSTDIRTGVTGNDPHWVTIKIYNDSTLNANGSVAGLLPAGYIIENIIFKETAGATVTGFDIGFTAGGGEIVANGNISASDEGSFTILQRVDDFDAADEIFFDATVWSGTLIIYIKMSRIF